MKVSKNVSESAAIDPAVETRELDLGDRDAFLPGAQLPTRPRRRLVTPPVVGLTALLLAAGGFLAGVEVQKGQGGSSTAGAGGLAAASGARTAGGLGRFGGPGGGAPSDVTFGTVSSKDGSSLYVKDSNGTVIRVKVSSASTISRTATASAGAIHPGDTVVVQGGKAKDGTVTATRVTATAAGASAGGGRGFGGGGGFGGGAPPTQGSAG
jgi:Domain of unknown function (DUF5666)